MILEKERYQQTSRAYENRLSSMAAHVQELEDTTKKFGEHFSVLEKEKMTAEGRELELKMQKDDVTSRLQETRERIQILHDREQLLKDQNQKLRSWVTRSTNEPIDDNTVTTRFASLRDQIQRIVFRFYPLKDSFHMKPWNLTQPQRDLFVPLQHGLSTSEVKYRVRAIIFQLLNQKILSEPVFGLGAFDSGGELESQLAKFERALASTKEGNVIQAPFQCT